jgi:hypothetical protein
MEGFGFFNDPDLQRRLQEMAEQMQSSQSLAWADNAIKLAVDMTVAAVNRINVQGTPSSRLSRSGRSWRSSSPRRSPSCAKARQGLA